MTTEYSIPEKYLEKIEWFLSKDKRYVSDKRFKKYVSPDFKRWLEEKGIPPKFLVYIYKNHLSKITIPTCPTCGKDLSFEQIMNGGIFCSKECLNKSDYHKEKIKQSNLQNYGFEYPTQSKEVQEKIKQTNLKRYGTTCSLHSPTIDKKTRQTRFKKYRVEHHAQSEAIKEKTKQTNLQKYGEDSFFKTDEFKEKSKETSLKRYGVEHPSQAKEIKEKKEQTTLKNYGVKNPFQAKEIKEKTKETNLERYGVENPLQSEEVREKQKQTNLERYGDENVFRIAEFKEKAYKTHKEKYYETFCELLKAKNIELLSSKEEFITNNVHKFKCLRCGTEFDAEGSNSQRIWCPSCIEKQGISTKEKDVLAFVKSIYNGTILENDRTVLEGKELDIYLPELNLAIEFNGNYWHSELHKDRYSHQEKSLECRTKGIRLIHIFEYEWDNDIHKVESLIKSALCIFDKTIYARDCKCKKVSSADYNAFLELNHLQGKVNSSARYGLYYKDELVSVIGFGKSRFKKDEFELYRFCNKIGYRIVGGFSKLIKHSNIKKFISYVDFAHFSGKSYETIGFKEISITEPNYVYVKRNLVLNRISAQKHKLPKLLNEGYDKNLSESDNMVKNGWLQVFDCGNLKMSYS